MMRMTERFGGRRLRRVLASGALVIAGAVGLVACGGSDSGGAEQASPGGSLSSILGDAHVHSLAVDREDPMRLWLGVHGGLYVSADAGQTWDLADLEGDDAMNLATAAKGAPLWVAGHDVLERSDDNGATWESVRPDGLPGLDLHGFAVRPDRPNEIVAAVAGQGLYRSEDSGASFQLLSKQVGPSVFGMALTADNTLFGADPSQGLFVSSDSGRTFRAAVQGAGLVSVAAVPRRPLLVLAGGEPGVIVSRDGGDLWESAFRDAAVAAVAIDPADPRRAYAVADDGRVFTTDDAARTWSEVNGSA
jgi:photosystem II stability/assembly factor-like uncharacterized protein